MQVVLLGLESNFLPLLQAILIDGSGRDLKDHRSAGRRRAKRLLVLLAAPHRISLAKRYMIP